MLNHRPQADPLDRLRVIGWPLFVLSIGAIDLWADGVHVVPLLGSAVIGLVVVLYLLLAGIVKRIHARIRVAVQVLPTSPPFHVQVLLRFLPRAIRVVCIPVLLLSLTGDTSGLLGLLCGIQLFMIGTCVGLLGWAHAWKYGGAVERQQERQSSVQAPFIRADSEKNLSRVLYGQSSSMLQVMQTDDHNAQPFTQYADYEQPQAQYPRLQ